MDTSVGENFDDRLNAADEALMQAKKQGRDRVIYHGVSDYYDVDVQATKNSAVFDDAGVVDAESGR